jgi:type I restriction-modification system DNA methylase subunit
MANERNTENIVRNVLRNTGYYDDETIIIEEQSSRNTRISKLLKKASKTGTGNVGSPEFIISFANKPDDIIIVECKASVGKHESPNKEKYYDYAQTFAVDGALWYASFLKEDFNVTAIAVSGENELEKKISSFLWLKNNYTFIETQEKIFPSPIEIENILVEQRKPFSQDDLIRKANDYNELLNEYSIPEIERCTLMSAILVSLQHKPFSSSYNEHTHKQNKELISALLTACKSVLAANGLSNDKIVVIDSEFSKFKTNSIFNSEKIRNKKTKKDEPNTLLRDFIKRIHKEILPYIQGNEFDILGQFYTIFIKYAGSDKKTGLVLTPSHITDFFCEISSLNKNDVVLDTCCGTAGFLVSAMNYMLKDAGHESEKRKEIKTNQLVGVEQRPDMFAHACSNMMMRGDGKSHIFYGDCFDVNIKSQIQEFHPTKTFLNPPYTKGNNGEQLEFLENALGCIETGGIGIAICKMGTVVSGASEVTQVKERLLQNHTLLGVLSMPTELFNPAASVPTAIIIFKAKQPHPQGYKSFFGFFKDDGFTVSKNKRTDNKNKWEEIKRTWINAFINRETIVGLSVMQEVTAQDEWCAEAYMETDYSTLTEKDFVDTLKSYVSYHFLNDDKS